MGKKGKAAEPTPEELDVEKYRITADLAVADANELRQKTEQQQHHLESMQAAIMDSNVEAEEVYQYLDAQMLAQGKERLTNETELRQAKVDAQRTQADLQRQLEELQRESSHTIELLRTDLATKDYELKALIEFRGIRPQMEAELADLKREVVHEQDSRRRDEHNSQVEMWRQREALNKQMMERMQQAKAKFLDITAEMLDSTVHRTMLENQNMTEEISLQASSMEDLIIQNEKLKKEKVALQRELMLQREQETAEVRRSLARRKLAQTATQQQDQVSGQMHQLRLELEEARSVAQVHETTISKLNGQLGAAQRRVGVLMQRVVQQESLIQKRLGGVASPTAVPATPNWSLILPTSEGIGKSGRESPALVHPGGSGGNNGGERGAEGHGDRRISSDGGGGEGVAAPAAPAAPAAGEGRGGGASHTTEMPMEGGGNGERRCPAGDGGGSHGGGNGGGGGVVSGSDCGAPSSPRAYCAPATAASGVTSAGVVQRPAASSAGVEVGGSGYHTARDHRPRTAAAVGSPRAMAGNRAVSAARRGVDGRTPLGPGQHWQHSSSGGSYTARAAVGTGTGGMTMNGGGYATDRDLLSAALIDHVERGAGYSVTQRGSCFAGRAVNTRPSSSTRRPQSISAGIGAPSMPPMPPTAAPPLSIQRAALEPSPARSRCRGR